MPKVLVGGSPDRAAGVAGKLGALLDFMSDRIAIAVCAYSQESRHCWRDRLQICCFGIAVRVFARLAPRVCRGLRGRDSNPELRDMNPPCYLCTTPRRWVETPGS